MGRIWCSLSIGIGLLVASVTTVLADPVAQIVRLSGSVEVARGNQSGVVQLGTALEAGDTVRTQADGRARIQFIDGSTINLGSQAELLIASAVSGGPGTERQIELDLGPGALRAFAAPATPKSRFEVRTPLAVTAVRGTEWGIFSTDLVSEILIIEGRVGIRRNIVSGESGMSLTGGRTISVTADGVGQAGRLSAEQVAALDAATSVPGTDIPFDPASAPAVTPTEAPPPQEESVPLQPQEPAEEQQEQSEQTPPEKSQDCVGTGSDCKPSKPRKDKDGGGNGGRGY